MSIRLARRAQWLAEPGGKGRKVGTRAPPRADPTAGNSGRAARPEQPRGRQVTPPPPSGPDPRRVQRRPVSSVSAPQSSPSPAPLSSGWIIHTGVAQGGCICYMAPDGCPETDSSRPCLQRRRGGRSFCRHGKMLSNPNNCQSDAKTSLSKLLSE